MRWVLQWVLLLLPCMTTVGSGTSHHQVFWNSSNTMFDANNDDHILEVRMGDKVEIICPHYSNTVSMNQWEYYLVYQVDRASYDQCVTSSDSAIRVLIANCSRPDMNWKSSLIIWELQPVPGAPSFLVGRDYYFISTSRGHQSEMGNQINGACQEHNMKVIFKVRDRNSGSGSNPTGGNSNNGQTTTRRTTGDNSGVQTENPVRTERPATTPTPRQTQPPRPATSTVPTTKSTTSRTPQQPNQGSLKDGDNCPGCDDFPNDNTVIRDGDNSNINSGVIADGGPENAAFSLHSSHRHCLLSAVVSLFFLLRLTVCR